MMTRANPDTVEIREIAAALRHGVRWIAGGVLLGALIAAALTAVARPRYEGTATILLRGESGAGMPSLSLGGALGGAAGALSSSVFDTEMQILTSRTVVGAVVDSLALQAQVIEPRTTAPQELFSSIRSGADLEPGPYTFTRDGGRFRVSGPGVDGHATPGVPFAVRGGEVTLRTGKLPDSFQVELLDRDAAIDAVYEDLGAQKAGGEVARLSFSAYSPVTAAAVPNGMIAHYLGRRRTIDRGVNQHRYEFLQAHADSIGKALAAAEQRLRTTQEATGVIDPAQVGDKGFAEAVRLQGTLADLEVESGALESMLSERRLSPRELAAYPSMLRNSAINSILDELLKLEVRRAELLERRTEQDEEVIAVNRQIRQFEGELVGLSRAYLSGLRKQQGEVQTEIGRYRSVLAAIPAQSQEHYRAQRDMKRLSETHLALQTQMVQARLAAMGEGGEVRSIDTAPTPKHPYYPRPLLNVAGGALGGLFFGVALTLATALVRRRVRLPWEAEVAAGAPASLLAPHAPLLLGGGGASGAVLVTPVGDGAAAHEVAARLAATAVLQGRRVALADVAGNGTGEAVGARRGALVLAGAGAGGTALAPVQTEDEVDGYTVCRVAGEAAAPLRVRDALRELEAQFDLVVAVLPGVEAPATVALLAEERSVVLVARAGSVGREALASAAAYFRRMGMEVAGVVLTPDRRRAPRP